MTATSQSRGSGLGILVLLGFGVVVLMAMGNIATLDIPEVGAVETRSHAVIRHGSDALSVRDNLANGEPPEKWRCRDGKIYALKRAGNVIDLMVIYDGVEITSFKADPNYVDKVLEMDGCHRCNVGHDLCSGPAY